MITALTLTLVGFQLAAMPKTPMTPIDIADAKGIHRSIPGKGKATCLFFVATDCPIANRMAPELSRIVGKYQAKGVSFAFIYVDPAQTATQVQRHLREYRLAAPGILDTNHQVVKAVGATVTPQAVVLSRQGMMLYRGRINDLFLEHGRARKAPKTEDLRIALDQVLAGKPVRVAQTPALGCSIPPLD